MCTLRLTPLNCQCASGKPRLHGIIVPYVDMSENRQHKNRGIFQKRTGLQQSKAPFGHSISSWPRQTRRRLRLPGMRLLSRESVVRRVSEPFPFFGTPKSGDGFNGHRQKVDQLHGAWTGRFTCWFCRSASVFRAFWWADQLFPNS